MLEGGSRMTRAGLAVALGLATMLALSGCSAGAEAPRRSPQPSAASQQPVSELKTSAPLQCTRPPARTVTGAPVVPTGAIAARLCGGLVDNAGFNLAWPADTLRGVDARRLVARLNQLKPYEQPTACTLPLTPGFDLVLLYPDGQRVRVDGDTSGTCEHVTVRGGGAWAGAPGVLRQARSLIEARRSADGPVDALAELVCPRRWNDVSFTAGAGPVRPDTRSSNGVTAIACRYSLDLDPRHITQSADGVLVGQAQVTRPAALVRTVADGSKVDPCGGVNFDLERIQDVILLQDRYGDTHVVSMAPCWANELTGQRRYPGHGLTGTVARLLS